MMIKSLKARNDGLADSLEQLKILNNTTTSGKDFPLFRKRVKEVGFQEFRPAKTDTLQVNIGKMCNQVCKHCHVDAGPDRKEIMSKETMQECLEVLAKTNISTVDLTGGAPEMNPHFRWFVEEISKLGKKTIVRCNLTIIVANPKYHSLPEFYKKHRVEVASSLPYFSAQRTDSQRGEGVFDASIKALHMLNAVGYGKAETGLTLNLIYNPGGAFLPASQQSLEKEFKMRLKNNYDIEFSNLFAITNLPVSRFLDYLVSSGNYEAYMEKLVNAFNPSAVSNVMCRNTISIGWDGFLYDCDFNQMLDLKVANPAPQHISNFDLQLLEAREIVLNQHCYGCTAGAGSSCGGEVLK